MLVDFQIEWLCTRKKQPLVTPYVPETVGPFSLGVHVGGPLLFGTPNVSMEFPNIRRFELPGSSYARSWAALDLDNYTAERPWDLKPGWVALVKTFESFVFPPTLTAQVVLDVACVLNGYGQTATQVVTGGYRGALTLAIINHNRYNDLPLFPGLRIAELFFTRSRHAPRKERTAGRPLGIPDTPTGKRIPAQVMVAIAQIASKENEVPQSVTADPKQRTLPTPLSILNEGSPHVDQRDNQRRLASKESATD